MAKRPSGSGWTTVGAVLAGALLLALAMLPGTTAHAAAAPWADTTRRYRVRITVGANGTARSDAPADVSVNFTPLLTALGQSASFDPQSIRVVEVDGNGTAVDSNVPYQFDQAAGFNAASNAAGDLVVLLAGSTSSWATRSYDVYFDVAGQSFTAVNVAPMVTLTDNVMYAGQYSFQIQTSNAKWYYQKTGGGFASIIDGSGNDWLSFNPTPGSGSGGEYRGIPNMGDHFHPGYSGTAGVVTTLEHSGPLKVTYRSETTDGWRTRWEIYPTYARMSVVGVPSGSTYWLLYEGTPGGVFNPGDTMTRSDGKGFYLSGAFQEPIGGNPEWAYFTSVAENRSLFLAHHSDTLTDTYRGMNNQMTVFGFGRSDPYRLLTATGEELTVGLVDTADSPTATAVINGDTAALAVMVGSADTSVPPATTTTTTTAPPPTTTTTTAPPPTTTTTTAPPPTTTTTTTPPPTTTTTTAPPPTTTTTTAPPPTTTTTTAPLQHATPELSTSGYWMVDSGGTVYGFGSAPTLGNPPLAPGTRAVKLAPTPSALGYWVLDDGGHVYGFGDAPYLGAPSPSMLAPGERTTALSATPTGRGYWIFTSLGRVFPFGDATSHGDMTGIQLNGPVLDSVATPSGGGYYMVASDGGIFAFGDATFMGSMGGAHLNSPVRSMAPTPTGHGYWLVASDGGIFSFGDAPFRGSMGAAQLNQPVVAMVPYGTGYLLVASDGGIFDFSDRAFLGSLGSNPPAVPVVGVAAVR